MIFKFLFYFFDFFIKICSYIFVIYIIIKMLIFSNNNIMEFSDYFTNSISSTYNGRIDISKPSKLDIPVYQNKEIDNKSFYISITLCQALITDVSIYQNQVN